MLLKHQEDNEAGQCNSAAVFEIKAQLSEEWHFISRNRGRSNRKLTAMATEGVPFFEMDEEMTDDIERFNLCPYNLQTKEWEELIDTAK